ncbi:hypothetical protein LCGC14_1047710 [marine sediment metagenome]|uniref:Uncharacterized protein n=1 Tax=marine sediment metagenome TaxID=412755 RepID=A0A0F9NBK9_9ZZZZ
MAKVKTIKYSKSSKQNTERIDEVLHDLGRVFAYLDRENVGIGQFSKTANTTLHYTNDKQAGTSKAAFYPTTKWVGSRLCYLQNAIKKLERFQEQTKQQ